MTAIIMSTAPGYTFGQMTNQMTARLINVASQIERLHEAIATASAGYDGAPGTQFEAPAGGGMGAPIGNATNLFGVIPSATPGDQGQAYRYAMDQLYEQWTTFWTAAKDYVEALDNGSVSM